MIQVELTVDDGIQPAILNPTGENFQVGRTGSPRDEVRAFRLTLALPWNKEIDAGYWHQCHVDAVLR